MAEPLYLLVLPLYPVPTIAKSIESLVQISLANASTIAEKAVGIEITAIVKLFCIINIKLIIINLLTKKASFTKAFPVMVYQSYNSLEIQRFGLGKDRRYHVTPA
jgi:hypothetical protein